jgi:hypothetical protein
MTGLLTDRGGGFCFLFEKKIEAYERREVLVGTLGRMLL